MPDVSKFDTLMTFLGGLTFFLYGVKKISTALNAAAGGRMKTLLGAITRNRPAGVLTGIFAAGLSNSLTLVSVLLVSFVSSDLITFERCIPVLMGAGIGSTFIGLLFVFKVTKYGLVLVTAGFGYQMIKKKEPRASAGEDQAIVTAAWQIRKQYAECVLGLGLVFYGSEVMGGAFVFMRSEPAVLEMFKNLDNSLVALVVGIVFTSIVQSSGASLGIYLSLAQEGLLSSRAGIALTLGANVGTCLTAVVAAAGEGVGAMQVATALILVRTVAAALFAIQPALLQLLVSPVCHQDTAAAQASCEIAASHTAFNLLLALLVVPFSDQYARLVKIVVRKLRRGQAEIDGAITEAMNEIVGSEGSAISIDMAELEDTLQEEEEETAKKA